MNGFTVTKHGRSRFWALRDGAGDLVCLCVYKRGAIEVARRLAGREPAEPVVLREPPPQAVGAGNHGFPKIPLDSLRPPTRESSRSVQMDNDNGESAGLAGPSGNRGAFSWLERIENCREISREPGSRWFSTAVQS